MNILQELYYGNVSECDRKMIPNILHEIDKELALYNKFREQLNNDEKAQFEDFITQMTNRHGLELEEKYIQGFKTGLLIAIESLNIELWIFGWIEKDSAFNFAKRYSWRQSCDNGDEVKQ